MAKHSVALHPINYAVWYEYVSGRSSDLKAEIERLTADGRALTEADVARLFKAYVAPVGLETSERVAENARRILRSMEQDALEATDRTSAFDQSLSQWQAELDREANGGAVLQGVVDSTREMSEAMRQLQSRLDVNQREIAQLRAEVAAARSEAQTDSLTGLHNRRSFEQHIAKFLADREAAMSLVLVDIDHFKLVNDTHGHLFGDQVLMAVARVLKESVRNDDLAARIGGEEFALLLPSTPLKGAVELAERIRTSIANSRIRRRNSEQQVGQITVSLGVADLWPSDNGESWFSRADEALYASKREGRNRVTAPSLLSRHAVTGGVNRS
ncbi:GGDEF domain-containing protein [Methylibium petroleiphilum]|jgi:diguanylate cyclase|nr:GGDEF domain-containing protein [Methylibium petroleiphilum]